MFAAVVLAAGGSSRMGRPKALLSYRGKTFLAGILDAVRAAAVDRLLVAVAPDDRKIIEAIDLTIATPVYNICASTAGPLGSIRAAVTAIINHPVEAMVVWPVDQPHVLQTTLEALLNEYRTTHSAITVPTFQGRRGHPVLFGRAVFKELLAVPAGQGARSVVGADPGRVREVEVFDPAVLDDIDTPEDYERLLGRSTRK